MDLLPSDEELSIAQTVAELLHRELPRELLRERQNEQTSISAEAWSICAESGLLALGLAEGSGGVGFGLVEEALAFREIGRELAPGPFLSSVIGARLAAEAGDTELVRAIVSGDRQVGLILPRAGATFDGSVVTGEVELVDATGSDLLLLLRPDVSALFDRASFASALPWQSIDPGVRLEVATAVGVEPVLAVVDSAELWARAVVLSSAILTGISEACRDASTTHAKTREQFGRPIGVNQAIKHRCADMAMYSEAASAQLLYAAAAGDAESADFGYQASIARVVASRAAISNAEANIQVHGGMGYTYEHDAHLYVKRARVWANLIGSRTFHLSAVIDEIRVAA
ncbi:MAG: putative Acyl-CoA dehydrogenase [Subtercola sp.]|nr:putative Acyl-CoA dehydrogenase [Subtercola sp.]